MEIVSRGQWKLYLGDNGLTLLFVGQVVNKMKKDNFDFSLLWLHNGRDCVSNHQPRDWLLNRLFRRRSKKISKLRVTGLCAGNSPGTGEFPAQMASNAENVSIQWRHHVGWNPDFESNPIEYFKCDSSSTNCKCNYWSMPCFHWLFT